MSRRSFLTDAKQSFKNDGPWQAIFLRALAEVLASAILVYIGCMGCVGSLAEPAPRLQIAMTFGFAIASLVHIIGPISHCQINPMVSLCSAILGTRPPTVAAIYMIAHFLGAIIGYGFLRVVTPPELLHNGNPETVNSFCVTSVNAKLSPFQGVLIEASAAAILIFFVCACADPRSNKESDAKAVKFGLLICMLSMACAPYTGCSMNPARSFAPALWNNVWKNHWIYWLGPISGTVMASVTYKTLFWPKKSMKEEIAEAVALTAINTEKSEMK